MTNALSIDRGLITATLQVPIIGRFISFSEDTIEDFTVGEDTIRIFRLDQDDTISYNSGNGSLSVDGNTFANLTPGLTFESNSFEFSDLSGNNIDPSQLTLDIPFVPDNTAPTFTSPDTATVDENQTFAIDGDGDDTLNGGEGNNTLNGGEGNDIFKISSFGEDTIEDFTVGEDTIRIFQLDQDDTISYNTGNGSLSVDGDTFANLTPGLTFESNSFEFSDLSGNNIDPSQLTLDIPFVPDNTAPTFTSPDTATVDENQTFAIDVEATDDNDSEGSGLTYSINGEDAGLFNIDDLGVINFNDAPDFETPQDADGNNDYLLEVSVSDSEGLITKQDLNISVSDVEEDNGGGNDNGNGNNGTEGTNGDDNLMGTDRKDTIDGGRGNDTIDGGKASDLLIGGLGEDSLIGGRGGDTLDGGRKADFLDGGNGKDSLIGGNGNDTLLGGVNQDTLSGDGGNDSLDGGGANDLLFGGDGVDTLFGGINNDTLIGGAKNDTLEGGRGSDTFVLAPSEGTDTIVDFELNRDVIGLSSGLSVEQLSFDGSKIIFNGETLANLSGIDTASLDEGKNFISI